jgi:hypothetical protein
VAYDANLGVDCVRKVKKSGVVFSEGSLYKHKTIFRPSRLVFTSAKIFISNNLIMGELEILTQAAAAVTLFEKPAYSP